jgi:hypothetical protein
MCVHVSLCLCVRVATGRKGLCNTSAPLTMRILGLFSEVMFARFIRGKKCELLRYPVNNQHALLFARTVLSRQHIAGKVPPLLPFHGAH